MKVREVLLRICIYVYCYNNVTVVISSSLYKVQIDLFYIIIGTAPGTRGEQ